jgi:hypothetical protein
LKSLAKSGATIREILTSIVESSKTSRSEKKRRPRDRLATRSAAVEAIEVAMTISEDLRALEVSETTEIDLLV